MDRLPPEILSRVCSFVSRDEIKDLRLVSRYLSNVATPQLITAIYLIFLPKSFDRMLAISRHPILSQYVTSIVYEYDTLDYYDTQVEWERHIIRCREVDGTLEHPGPSSTERERRAYNRALGKAFHKPVQKIFPAFRKPAFRKKAYKAYLDLFNGQENLRKQGYGFAIITDAMTRFPKLEKICMSEACAAFFPTNYSKNAFGAGLLSPFGLDQDTRNSGQILMRSLLVSAYEAGTKLTSMRIGYPNWKLITNLDRDLWKVKEAMRDLRELFIFISRDCEDFDNEDEMLSEDIPEGQEHLDNNGLIQSLTAATQLETLAVYIFWDEPFGPVEIKQIVGDFTWRQLKRVEFRCVEASEEDWISFFKRHSQTLREVSLEEIGLFDGSWITAFDAMYDVCQLERVRLKGNFYTKDPYFCLHFGRANDPHKKSRSDPDDRFNQLRWNTEKFLVHGGPNPLYHVLFPQEFDEETDESDEETDESDEDDY
ncbi:MAG: hypothetical protein Q9190_005490 [Brigantiaea leucoxantha]